MCMYSHIIAVTSRHLCSRPFLEQIRRVCSYHPKAVLLREKDLSEQEYTILAVTVMEICKTYQVPCILHTYFSAAKTLHCPAIHLPLPLLRLYHDQLKEFDFIGSSVHSLEEAKEAQSLGVSYLTAGHIYETNCKKGVPARGLSFLRSICSNVSVPVYGIGGIKLDKNQLDEVIKQGAAGGCIMSGMMEL